MLLYSSGSRSLMPRGSSNLAIPVASGALTFRFSAKGDDLYSLLFDWLDKVMLLLVSDGIAMSQFSVKIQQANDNYLLEGTARGEPLELDRHHYKVEIKAVTYHEMEIKQEKGIITARFLLDL